MNPALARPALVLALCAACGGSASTQGVTGADSGASTDSGAMFDAGPLGDGGCIEQTPTQGSACTEQEVLCNPGNLCCGGEWSCSATSHEWNLLQGGCACQGGEAGIVDAATDDATASDAARFACGTLTCDAATQYCSIEYSPIQGPTSYACVESEAGPPSCQGVSVASPGDCGCYESPNGEVTIAACPP